MSKTISILGATGSIGRQTLDVAEQLGLRVAALTAHMQRGAAGGAGADSSGPAWRC